MKLSDISRLIFSGFTGMLALCATSCSEIPDPVTVDINEWTSVADSYEYKTYTLNHPCLLHSRSDIDYVKAHLGQSPWAEAYADLCATPYASADYQMHTPKDT